MELSNIQQFLEVYRKKLFAEEDEIKSILHAINSVCGISLHEGDISIQRGVVTTKVDSTTRNHVFLYKAKILDEIKRTSKRPIFDIN